ncbi:MAG: hypothetical protein AB1635_05245 [Acidobacteriota bacterium]
MPTGWEWITDTPATRQTERAPGEGKWLFAVMAPGWHITTRPGAVLYEPSYAGRGRYAVEAETFLFPGTSQSGFGLMIGGRDLDGPAPHYTAFLVRRDGSVAVERRAGAQSTMLVEWANGPSVATGPADRPIRNLLRVDVEPAAARLLVNGEVVAEVARPAEEFAGQVGLRIGADTDIHVSTLDLTLKMALPRPTP